MHHLTLAGLAALAVAAAPAGAATRGYIVTDFDNLRLEGPVEVFVETGRGASARGEGDADMLARVDLAVSARTLVVRLKPSPYEARRERQSGPAKLFLTAPVLRRIQLTGAGSVRARGLDKLNAEVTKVVNSPAVREAWAKQGAVPMVMSPKEFDTYLRKDIDKWADVVQKTGASAK